MVVFQNAERASVVEAKKGGLRLKILFRFCLLGSVVDISMLVCGFGKCGLSLMKGEVKSRLKRVFV